MSVFVPDIYQKDIYSIDYDKLASKGIKCVLFDLDNTLVSAKGREINDRVYSLIKKLKKIGFIVLIFSNSPKKRVYYFKEKYDIDAVYFACKPFGSKFKRVLKKYGLKSNELAIVGDQLLTDILGGNFVGIVTILIDPITNVDCAITVGNRFFEKIIFNNLAKRKKFMKGNYYD